MILNVQYAVGLHCQSAFIIYASGFRQAFFLPKESAIKHAGSKCKLQRTEYAVNFHLSLCLFTWPTHFNYFWELYYYQQHQESWLYLL